MARKQSPEPEAATTERERESVVFGRLGGHTRAANMTAERRTEIARHAAQTRHSRDRARKAPAEQQSMETTK
jgi:hypothetical protein